MNENLQLILVGLALLWAGSRVVAGLRQWRRGDGGCGSCTGCGDCSESECTSHTATTCEITPLTEAKNETTVNN